MGHVLEIGFEANCSSCHLIWMYIQYLKIVKGVGSAQLGKVAIFASH